MSLVGNGEFAIAQGVPQLDCTVSRPGNNLAVVGGEGDGENVVVVADEAAGCGSCCELPQAEGLVPGGGEGIGAVGGDDLIQKVSMKSAQVEERALHTQSETI